MHRDVVAVRLNGPKAEHEDITIDLDLTDIDERHAIHVRHGVRNHWPRHLPKPDATLTLSRSKLIEAFTAPALLDAALDILRDRSGRHRSRLRASQRRTNQTGLAPTVSHPRVGLATD